MTDEALAWRARAEAAEAKLAKLAAHNGLFASLPHARFIPKRACEGAATIDHGDMRQCPHPGCGVSVVSDMVDHGYFGFAASCPLKALSPVAREAGCADAAPTCADGESIESLREQLQLSESARVKAEEERDKLLLAQHAANNYAYLYQEAEAKRVKAEQERDEFCRIAQKFHNALVGHGMAGAFNMRLCEEATAELDALTIPEADRMTLDYTDELTRAEAKLVKAEEERDALKRAAMPEGMKCRDLGECVSQLANLEAAEATLSAHQFDLDSLAEAGKLREKVLQDSIDGCAKRVKALADALSAHREIARYAQHKEDCGCAYGWERWPCSCGLSQLMAKLDPQAHEET